MTRWIDFDAIRAEADFRPILRRYGLVMRSEGSGLVGSCPFHPDRIPSFRVSLEKQVFHCFGCRAKGDVFDFVSKKEVTSIREAAELIAEWFRLSAVEDGVSGSLETVDRANEKPPHRTALAWEADSEYGLEGTTLDARDAEEQGRGTKPAT